MHSKHIFEGWFLFSISKSFWPDSMRIHPGSLLATIIKSNPTSIPMARQEKASPPCSGKCWNSTKLTLSKQFVRKRMSRKQNGKVSFSIFRQGVLMLNSSSNPLLSMIISVMFLYSFYFAISRGSLPLQFFRLRSQPRMSSFLTIRPFPDITARWSGVMPQVKSCLSISAPQARRAQALFSCPEQQAQCRAVLPFPSSVLIFMPLFRWEQIYHEYWGIALRSDVHDRQPLLVDCVYVCSPLLEKKGQLGIAAKDRIVKAGEALVVLAVQPGPAAGLQVWVAGLEVFEKVSGNLVIVVVGSDVKDSSVIGIKEGVSLVEERGEEFACLLLVERLDGFEKLSFTHQELSILITTHPEQAKDIALFQPSGLSTPPIQDDLATALQDPTDFLPTNYKYLLLSFRKREYILPYPHELLTFREIAKMLVEQVKIVQKEEHWKLNPDTLEMKLEMGAFVDPEDTIQGLRIKLCRKKIDGIRIRAEIVNGICDEAALNVFMPAEVDYQSSPIEKTFLLLNNQQPFYISLKKDGKPQTLKPQLAEILTAFYALEIKSADIRLFDLVKSEQELQGIQWSAKSELSQAEVMKKIKVKETELIGVQIRQNLAIPNPQIADQRFLTIRLDAEHAVRFKFANVSKYKVYDILKILKLRYPESHSLKIGDQIYRPVQLMEQMRRYFEAQNSLALNIEATLVSEKETFYSCLERFSPHPIKPDMVDKQTEQQFTKCVERARSCAESTISSELDSDEKIRPITFYTGSFRILDQQGPVLLYKAVNELLREQPFGMYGSKLEDYNKEWKYIFAAELIKSIRSLPEHPHQELYRGIPMHQMQGEVGQIYESKQFLSTTLLQNKANHFLKRNNVGSLLKIRGLTGRYIAPFSIYPQEKEVLFMPYTRFRITEKDKSNNIWKITLEEIVDNDYQSNFCTYILWVDDKLKEAKKVIASLNCPIQNTFFVQLVSNQKLREWIESNSSYIENPRIRIAIISNMKRTEDGTFLQDAGAHTALLARQLIPDCPFIFYIGNVDGTKQALKKNKIDINAYPITNKRPDLRSFIQKICVPIVEEKKESLLEREKENWLKFFNPQISSASSS